MEAIWTPEVEESLSFSWWEAHLHFLAQECGWADALKKESFQFPLSNSHHRVVTRLRKFVESTGLVNAHFGLTSSNVEDNVRRVQLNHAMRRCRVLLRSFTDQLMDFSKGDKGQRSTNAYTHWQYAGRMKISHRVRAWISPLEAMNIYSFPSEMEKNSLSGLLMGGPVGDFSDLVALMQHLKPYKQWNPGSVIQMQVEHFPWFTFSLGRPWNLRPLQSSDHVDEENAIAWICRASAQIHKIAADWRFLCSQGDMASIHPKGYVGSSSIPHKNNPIKWEKACSIARAIFPAHREMLDVMAHNGCERTLDTSWQVKNCMKRTTELFEKLLLTMMGSDLAFTPQSEPELAKEGREEKTHRILSGEHRAHVYKT